MLVKKITKCRKNKAKRVCAIKPVRLFFLTPNHKKRPIRAISHILYGGRILWLVLHFLVISIMEKALSMN